MLSGLTEISEAELERYISIRSQRYNDRLGLNIEVKDKWDKLSQYFLVRNKNKVVGGCRIICRSRTNKLPMEEDGLDIKKIVKSTQQGRVAEISRLAVEQGLEQNWIHQLFDDIYLWVKENKVETLLSVMPRPQAKLYARALKSHAKATGIQAVVSVYKTIKQPEALVSKYNNIVDSMIVWENPNFTDKS